MIPVAVAALLTLIVGLWLTLPLWRGTQQGSADREAANVAVFRSRSAELERDREAGMLDAETAAAMLEELKQRVLQDVAVADAAEGSRQRAGWITAPLLIVGCGLLSALLYLGDGSWKVAGWLKLAQSDPRAAQTAALESTVLELEQALREHPDDLDRLQSLAQAYLMLGRSADALAALKQLNERGGQNPDWLVAEGEARLAAAGEAGDPLARTRFEQAVALAPAHGRALWFAGMTALEAGDYRAARDHWAALTRQRLPDEMRGLLERRVAELDRVLGDSAPAADLAVADTRIRLRVQLSGALAGAAKPEQALFVFARQVGGPPMPLAVYRGLASELPAEIVLDDSLAMTPASRLSQHDRWEVSARVSRSGQALPGSGDLQGTRIVERAQLDQQLELVIDTRVP